MGACPLRKGESVMKMSKRFLSVLLAAMIGMGAVTGALAVFAIESYGIGEKNPAWLSGFYVRETSTDFSKKEMVPHSDSQYGQTLSGFLAEVAALKKTCTVDLDDLTEEFRQIIQRLYDMFDNTNLFRSYEEMKSYLQTEHGITYPNGDTATSPMYTAVLYVCLKYDVLTSITGRPLEIPEGSSIDLAITILVADVLGQEVPEGVDSLAELAVERIKQILKEIGIDVPENASPEQVVLYYKIMIAEQQGYPIENHDVANYTQADLDKLNGSYYAAIVKKSYGVSISPADALAAVNTEDPDVLAREILIAMIESKGQSASADASTQALFDQACKLGFFSLKNGFYPDIYDYDVYLNYKCSEVWLTAYSYASELGQNELDHVKMEMNGASIQNGKSYLLKLTGDETKVVVTSRYENGGAHNSTTYTFRIHNGTKDIPKDIIPDTPPEGSGDMPNFTIPNIDSDGEYSPLSEDGVFNPYDTDGEGVSEMAGGEAVTDATAVNGSPDAKAVADGGGSSGTPWWAIVLSVGGGVLAGGGGIVGLLFLVKKKGLNLF